MKSLFFSWASSQLWIRALMLGVATLLFTQSTSRAAGPVAFVGYSPAVKVLQGVIPFTQSYDLTVTAPANLLPGISATVGFSVVVNTAPDGVSSETALSYLTFSTNQLTFVGQPSGQPLPNQTVTLTLAVPAGAPAGSYGYQITTTGWGVTLAPSQNVGASINATTALPPGGNPPVVEFIYPPTPADGSTITVEHTALPLSIPIQVRASAAPTDTVITSVLAKANDTTLTLAPLTGLNSRLVEGSATLSISQPGVYSLDVSATNEVGTGTDNTSFTVRVSGPPPVATITSPGSGQEFVFRAGGAPVPVPITFTGTSSFGPVRSLTAKVNGVNVDFSANGLGTGAASGAFTPTYTTAGTHTLEVTTTNDYGSDSETLAYVVRVVAPSPTIDVSAPTEGLVIMIPAGATTVDVPFRFVTTSDNGFTVDAVSANLGTASVAGISTTGLGTASAVSTGTLSGLPAGTYTLTAEGTSAGIEVSDSVTFSVKSSAVTPPTVVINTPPAGAVFTRVYGGPALSIPLTFTGTSQTSGGVITELTASLGSRSLGVAATNLNTKTAIGAATISVSNAGTYTISVTAKDAYGTASATRTFRVAVVEGKTVCGEVFFDVDSDRFEDREEFGVACVTVKLVNAAGQVVASDVTDYCGKYSFSNVAPGGYKVVATAPIGLVATTAIEQSVTIGSANIAAPDIGFFLNFTALQGMNADGKSHGFWKNNVSKAISGKINGAQVSRSLIVTYTARIGDFALAPYDDVSMKTALAIMSSKSAAPKDLLSLQLVASEYNYQQGAFIGGNKNLTFYFLYWGEYVLANSSRCSSSYVLWAKDWFDAYNNSYGGRVDGPSSR
jgi:PKD repeat protein